MKKSFEITIDGVVRHVEVSRAGVWPLTNGKRGEAYVWPLNHFKKCAFASLHAALVWSVRYNAQYSPRYKRMLAGGVCRINRARETATEWLVWWHDEEREEAAEAARKVKIARRSQDIND